MGYSYIFKIFSIRFKKKFTIQHQSSHIRFDDRAIGRFPIRFWNKDFFLSLFSLESSDKEKKAIFLISFCFGLSQAVTSPESSIIIIRHHANVCCTILRLGDTKLNNKRCVRVHCCCCCLNCAYTHIKCDNKSESSICLLSTGVVINY